MFRLLNFIGSVIFAYYLIENSSHLHQAFKNNAGTDSILYYGIQLLFWTVCLGVLYVATFGGSELYVTTKNEEKNPTEEN